MAFTMTCGQRIPSAKGGPLCSGNKTRASGNAGILNIDIEPIPFVFTFSFLEIIQVYVQKGKYLFPWMPRKVNLLIHFCILI